MSKAARIKAHARRAVSVVRRHGVVAVGKVVVSSVLQRGVLSTMRAGRDVMRFAGGSGEGAARGDLDAGYSLTVADWARLRPTGAPQASSAPSGAAAVLAFVVQGEESTPGDLARTHAAVAALGHGARLWNAPAVQGEGPIFWVFLKPGDEPDPGMPAAFAQIARGGVTEVISFDLWRQAGLGIQPVLAPGANPVLLRAADYLFSRIAVAAGAAPLGQDPTGLNPRAFVLDWMRGRTVSQVRGRWRHISRPLLMARISDQDLTRERARALEHGRRPMARKPGQAPVSVVICTHNKGHLTRQLVQGLIARSQDVVGDVVIVSNNTSNAYALTALQDLARLPRVQVVRRDEPFNFSRLSNFGARSSRGDGPLLFLNDDIAPVSEDWLSRLAAWLDDPDVGSAGPLLLYPDERVQHAGMYLGYRGGAGHTLRHARLPDDDYMFTAAAPREVTALTGACLLTPRPLFEALNGFDEQLATYLQDVDYCLRLRAVGKLNVFDPAAILIHMESASIRPLAATRAFQARRHAERARFVERWGALLTHDPLHPAAFDLEDETLKRLARAR